LPSGKLVFDDPVVSGFSVGSSSRVFARTSAARMATQAQSSRVVLEASVSCLGVAAGVGLSCQDDHVLPPSRTCVCTMYIPLNPLGLRVYLVTGFFFNHHLEPLPALLTLAIPQSGKILLVDALVCIQPPGLARWAAWYLDFDEDDRQLRTAHGAPLGATPGR